MVIYLIDDKENAFVVDKPHEEIKMVFKTLGLRFGLKV
jgi:hypothetical protein